MLKEHLNGKTTGRVFESRQGTPLNANNISKRILKPLLKELKLDGSFHSFRHGRVSVLQQAGIPGDLIKEWVGHSSLRVTSRYTHFDNAFRKETVGKLAVGSPPSPPSAEEPANGAVA
jgi:integrase